MGGIIHRLDPVRNSEFTEFSPSIPSLLGIDIPKPSRACGLFAPPWIAGDRDRLDSNVSWTCLQWNQNQRMRQ